MRMRRLTSICAGMILCLGVVANAQEVSIKTTRVAGNVYMLEGSGGNIGVSVGADGILIVDDQFARLAEKIRAALRDISEGKLEFLLNTHWHGDHTGGNEVFGREATIIAHENVRKRMVTGAKRPERTIEPSPEGALPVITFDSSLSLHFNGEEIKAIHAPQSHTDGDCVVYFTGSNVVHMGDLFFSGLFPFVDLASGGDVEGYIHSVKKVLDELSGGVKIIPGHGPLSTLDDLESFHTMLVETTRVIRARMKDGRSLDEIKDAGLGARWDSWSWSFIPTERWIETVYNSYSPGERR
ncbi:MAG: MBL fold metallo-hydrolase [Candidatus Krumholzibacteriia bacterium]